jgi:hypothetical protein
MRVMTGLDPYLQGMLINHDPQYEMLAALPASLGQYESRPPQRPRVTNMHTGLPAGGPPAARPRPWSEEDTPVYWQTVQALASGWRLHG